MSEKIRPYQSTDLEDLLETWESASAVGHPFLDRDFLDQERKNIEELYLPNTETWVWEEAGQVVGFVSLMGTEVGALFVRVEHHGRGLGRALMDKARSLRDDLEVEVFEENRVGRAFYERYGFVPIETKVHEATGLVVLRLKLDPEAPG
ncbi:MAG: GNAT family N-acetyltransferase [Planctomycetota bacterium]